MRRILIPQPFVLPIVSHAKDFGLYPRSDRAFVWISEVTINNSNLTSITVDKELSSPHQVDGTTYVWWSMQLDPFPVNGILRFSNPRGL